MKGIIDEMNKDLLHTYNGSVQFLLAGNATGHILKVIEVFNPGHIEIFTSPQLRSSVNDFIMSLTKFKGTHHVQSIPSFTESSILSGISIISDRYKVVKANYPDRKIYFGITGGTNTMAVTMAITALLFGEKMHYVVKDLNDEDDFGKLIMFDSEAICNSLDGVFSRRVNK